MQNILDIKTKLETQAQNEYGIANRKYLEEQAALQELMIRRVEYEKSLKELVEGMLDIKSINNAIGGDLYIKYFDNYAPEENVFGKSGINNILFLDSYLDKDVKSNISNNIKNLLQPQNNMFIKEVKKTEYGIYTLGYRFNLNVPNSLIF